MIVIEWNMSERMVLIGVGIGMHALRYKGIEYRIYSPLRLAEIYSVQI